MALQLHSAVHGAQLPFQCSLCLYRTVNTVSLNKHIQQHTCEQRYVCCHADCNYTSNSSSNMRRHLKNHTNTSAERENNSAYFTLTRDSKSEECLRRRNDDDMTDTQTLLEKLSRVVDQISPQNRPIPPQTSGSRLGDHELADSPGSHSISGHTISRHAAIHSLASIGSPQIWNTAMNIQPHASRPQQFPIAHYQSIKRYHHLPVSEIS